MDGLAKFIADARANGTSDDEIMQLLTANGWNELQVKAALAGLTVPAAPAATEPAAPAVEAVPYIATTPNPAPTSNQRPSISALEAALQHVLLWLFTGTSSIMIGIVSAALFTQHGGSSESLLTYVVMETITFLPFLVLFLYYLRQQKRQNDLMTGKVWSIITIVLHSLGALGALITFVLVILLVHDDNSGAGLAAAAAIFVLDAVVVAAYSMANFTKSHDGAVHRKLLMAFPAVLFIVIAIFGVLALMRVGPLKADDQTSQNLVTATKNIHNYAQDHGKLPATADQISNLPDGVSYQKTSNGTYKLCADFRQSRTTYTGNGTIYDDYTGTYDFTPSKAGQNCWTVTNMQLEEKYRDSGVRLSCGDNFAADCASLETQSN